MRFIFSLFIYFSIFNAQAQQNNSTIIKIQYLESENQGSPITNNYEGTLFVQGSKSYYNSKYKNSENDNSKSNSGNIILNSNNSKFIGEIFSDMTTNELVENTSEENFLNKTYSITDNNEDIKWTITKEEKNFNNILCKKATADFRGRKYTAWFTEKYPISAGPWKFHGLPGLILYIQDNTGSYKWQLVNIAYPYKGNDFNMETNFNKRYKYTKITFKDYDKKRIDAINDKIDLIQARNASRSGMKASFSYSTDMEKEPTNAFRKQTYFK